MRLAVFIDAGYFWKSIWNAIGDVTQSFSRDRIDVDHTVLREVIIEYIDKKFKNIPLLRCYWYDGPTLQGKLTSSHEKIAKLHDFKLRLGHRAVDNGGTARQKGVDGLIITDLISLAQRGVVTHALLLSGDGDMVPGVFIAQSLGIRVHLLSIASEHGISSALKSEVDVYDILPSNKICTFAKIRRHITENTIASETNATPQDIVVLHCGAETIDGPPQWIVTFYESLSPDERSAISSTFIPREIDKHLLRLGYENNNYHALLETQKRLLRKQLKSCLVSINTNNLIDGA